jgi:hypothetical protein
MEALWGRGLEACAMQWRVCVLKDCDQYCSTSFGSIYRWPSSTLHAILLALLWYSFTLRSVPCGGCLYIDIVFGCFCVFLWWYKNCIAPIPHLRSCATCLTKDFGNRFRRGDRGWNSAISIRKEKQKKRSMMIRRGKKRSVRTKK